MNGIITLESLVITIERIPSKIASGFANFTANQKNWILVYSLVALKNRLSDPDFTCWANFDNTCVIVYREESLECSEHGRSTVTGTG